MDCIAGACIVMVEEVKTLILDISQYTMCRFLLEVKTETPKRFKMNTLSNVFTFLLLGGPYAFLSNSEIKKLQYLKFISEFNYLKNENRNSLVNSIIKQSNNKISLSFLVSLGFASTHNVSFLEFEFSIPES